MIHFCTYCSADISQLTVRNFCPCCGKPVNKEDRRKNNSGRPRLRAFQILPESITQEYKDGSSILDIAAAHGSNFTAIRNRLVELGVEIKRPGWRKCGKDSRKVADILLRHAGGETMEKIGSDHGISRERVRQIAAMHKLPSRAEVKRPEAIQKAFDRLAKNEDARVRHIAMIADFSKMWKRGASLATMASALGISERTVTQRAVYYRRRNPDMFPRRRAVNGTYAPRRMPKPHSETLFGEARKLIESSNEDFSQDSIWQKLRDRFPTPANKRNLSNLFFLLKKSGAIEIVKKGGRILGCSIYRKANLVTA